MKLILLFFFSLVLLPICLFAESTVEINDMREIHVVSQFDSIKIYQINNEPTNYATNSYLYFDFPDNFSITDKNWLSEEICILSYNEQRYLKANFDFSDRNEESEVVNYLKSNGRTDILQNNLWMKTEISNSKGETTNILVPHNGMSEQDLANLLESKGFTSGEGITATPIDSKCDFNQNGKVDDNERSSSRSFDLTSFTPPVIEKTYKRYVFESGNEFNSENYSKSYTFSTVNGDLPNEGSPNNRIPAGRYYVTENENELGLIEDLFCDKSIDSDCDSIPKSKDICPDTYGSAYFLGCPQETISLSETKTLSSCTGDKGTGANPSSNVKGTLTYNSETNTLTCKTNSNDGDKYKDYIIFEDTNGLIAENKGNITKVKTTELGTYSCYNDDDGIFGGDDHIDTCTLESQNVQTSVFDLDLDGKKYYSQKWIDEFEYDNKNGFTNEDDCPASYGTDLRGCPVINQEDVTVEDDKITFEDEAKNKIAIDENSHIYINDQFIATYTPFTKSVNVSVQNSCIPTVRFSKLAKTNKDIENKLRKYIGNDKVVTKGLNPTNRDDRLKLETAIAQLKKEEQQKLYSTIKENLDCDTSYTREDSLTPQSVLLALHHLNPVDNATKTLELINDAMNTTSQLEFEKTITPKENEDSITTQIDLDIGNIPANTTIWQIIPKENAPDIEELLKTAQIGNATQFF